MIAIATLFTTAYGGYVGAPWWSLLICAATLVVTQAASQARVQTAQQSLSRVASLGFDFLPHCLVAAIAAYGVGQATSLVLRAA